MKLTVPYRKIDGSNPAGTCLHSCNSAHDKRNSLVYTAFDRLYLKIT